MAANRPSPLRFFFSYFMPFNNSLRISQFTLKLRSILGSSLAGNLNKNEPLDQGSHLRDPPSGFIEDKCLRWVMLYINDVPCGADSNLNSDDYLSSTVPVLAIAACNNSGKMTMAAALRKIVS
ncbi:hypothetical protein KIN20_033890 [Parelaphostrongylus tenuis]|uniref:Uncharacterized protein n=1 Tax=Parelaphostrongylus tenuis TaxID=148309 RepID=A0AAD5R8T5_PARTN|nr:hypothetical protein KIN20_033890 [Parelaphostrongylus tenuis]